MDEILDFLNDNYVYAIGIGLIIVIMLIGVVTSKKKKKKEEKEQSVTNVNDNNQIGEEVNNLNQEIKPQLEVANQNLNVPVNEDNKETVGQSEDPSINDTLKQSQQLNMVANQNVEPNKIQPVEMGETENKNNDIQSKKFNQNNIGQSTIDDDVMTIDDSNSNVQQQVSSNSTANNLEKTEIIDLSGAGINQSENKNSNNNAFIPDTSQYDTNDMLNGEETVVKKDETTNS